MDELTEQDWPRLLEAIKRGNCVLVTGQDVVYDPDDPERRPLNSVLARKLAASLSPPPPEIVLDDLAQVTQILYNTRGDRIGLELALRDFYESFAERTSDFHKDLAALPFKLCLTTTPARFMVNAFRDANKSPVSEFYNYREHRSPDLMEGHPDRPVVYHLYGDLEELGSLVITETDLLEMLVSVVKGAPSKLPPTIAAQLADRQTSFLFLGFGFQRWYARVLLHVLREQTSKQQNLSLAVEGPNFFEHPDSTHITLFFEHEHKIEFRHHSWSDFAADLRQRYEIQRRSVAPRELPENAPKVFLCHDSRDHDRVLVVEQRLHELGIDTWRDQQNLRGGDDWNRRIEQVLKKGVDYVLVLETPQMLERPESYLHKEIAEALERQKYFDQGQHFVIPVMLVACDGLERLQHLHRFDLTNDQGLSRLVQEIQADWTKRHHLRAGAQR